MATQCQSLKPDPFHSVTHSPGYSPAWRSTSQGAGTIRLHGRIQDKYLTIDGFSWKGDTGLSDYFGSLCTGTIKYHLGCQMFPRFQCDTIHSPAMGAEGHHFIMNIFRTSDPVLRLYPIKTEYASKWPANNTSRCGIKCYDYCYYMGNLFRSIWERASLNSRRSVPQTAEKALILTNHLFDLKTAFT